MNYQSKNRIFQVWDYTVIHGMLLIRSPGEGIQSTIDLIFHGTQFMSIPRHVGEISIHSADANARLALASLWPKLADKDEVFVVSGQGTNHYVVAAGMKVNEHHNGIFWNAFGDLRTSNGIK